MHQILKIVKIYEGIYVAISVFKSATLVHFNDIMNEKG